MHENGQLNLSFHLLWISLMFLSNIFCYVVNVDITLMVVPHFYLFIQSIIHFSAFVEYTLDSWQTRMHKTCRIKILTKYKFKAFKHLKCAYPWLLQVVRQIEVPIPIYFFYSCVILFYLTLAHDTSHHHLFQNSFYTSNIIYNFLYLIHLPSLLICFFI